MTWRLMALIVLAALGASPTSAENRASGDAAAAFADGNARYEAGDYEGAIASYLGAAKTSAPQRDILYNLGNAYFKAGSPGKAVVYYERTRRLAPRDEDARANLGLVRSLLPDQQFLATDPLPSRVLLWVPRHLSPRELLAFSSVFFTMLCIACVVFVFRDTAAVQRGYRPISVLSPGRLLGLDPGQDLALAIGVVALLFGATAAAAWRVQREGIERSAAVAVSVEVPVFGAPNREGTLQFRIHEGTMARVTDTRPGWFEIELPGDLSGWVSDEAMERI